MQEIPQPFQALVGNGCAEAMGATGLFFEHREATLVEATDDIAHGLVVAAQLLGDDGGSLSLR